jgi:hypothetical protein
VKCYAGVLSLHEGLYQARATCGHGAVLSLQWFTFWNQLRAARAAANRKEKILPDSQPPASSSSSSSSYFLFFFKKRKMIKKALFLISSCYLIIAFVLFKIQKKKLINKSFPPFWVYFIFFLNKLRRHLIMF